MEWHFGDNCTHFVPTLGKCRVLIARYNKRADLLADKWLKTRDLLVYAELSPHALIAQVKGGEVQAKKVEKPKNPEESGYWRFLQRCSWDWDNCALGDTGGHCTFFEPHDGEKITCLMDLQRLGGEHPNMAKVPSDDDVRLLEGRLSALQGQAS
jgi:hypothetical protein